MSGLFTTEFILRLIGSLVGTLAFAIIFNMRARHLPFAGACGMITYAIYHVCVFFGVSVFVAALGASAFTALFSELCARVRKAPAVVFLIPGVIPIVPGGDLYHTMRCLLSNDMEGAFYNLGTALKVGVGIAGGIVAISVVFGLISGALAHNKSK